MLYCRACGARFEADEAVHVDYLMGEYWGMPAYETWNACPNCKSTEIEEIPIYEHESEDEDDEENES